ncbi:hypothetical protein LCGC14_0883680, partial [marine sediment metagenome]
IRVTVVMVYWVFMLRSPLGLIASDQDIIFFLDLEE